MTNMAEFCLAAASCKGMAVNMRHVKVYVWVWQQEKVGGATESIKWKGRVSEVTVAH